MIEFEEISLRNFMSFGNTTETIPLNKDSLTLVLGENRDKGEDAGERNGVGKSSVALGIHFALFGQSIGNKIKRANLINKTNQKELEVELKFKKDNSSYTIKRYRRPEKLEFYVDDHLVNVQGGDEGQGEMRETQEEINRVLGVTPDMFSQSIILSTYVEPFLSQGSGKQREMIEELLGITQLSEKAVNLKEMLRETKTQLEQEEFKIKTLTETNERIRRNHEQTIQDLKNRSNKWQEEFNKGINQLKEAIDSLSDININQEIKNHELLVEWKEKKKEQDSVINELERLSTEKGRHERTIQQAEKRLEELNKDLISTQEYRCPTCGHTMHDQSHERVLFSIEEKIKSYQDQLKTETESLTEVNSKLIELEKVEFDLGPKPDVFYDDVKEAYKHKGTLKSFKDRLKAEETNKNPFLDQIESQPEAPVHEINVELRDDLIQLRDHQDFLLKLLTSKDSSVRKRILDQNITYLNARLGLYLEKLGLQHEVEFMNDLSTTISMLGNEYDFASLSRGERARLTLGLTFSFRDVWESLNYSTNLLFIDEVLDNGIDTAGLESALKTLKHMARDRAKNIFIVSHREELISRSSNVMSIIKEGGFSRVEWSREEIN